MPRHDLRPLIDKFDELLRQQLRIEIPAHLKNDPLIFAVVDPNCQGFRYSHTTAEKRQLLPGEYLVPLLGLQRFAEEVSSFIEDILLDASEPTPGRQTVEQREGMARGEAQRRTRSRWLGSR